MTNFRPQIFIQMRFYPLLRARLCSPLRLSRSALLARRGESHASKYFPDTLPIFARPQSLFRGELLSPGGKRPFS